MIKINENVNNIAFYCYKNNYSIFLIKCLEWSMIIKIKRVGINI